MEVLLLSFRETKREITVVKIDEKKEETGKRLVNDCSFWGHLPTVGKWEIPFSQGMVLWKEDVSASVIRGKFGSSQTRGKFSFL